MDQLTYTDGVYRTEPQRVSLCGRLFPSLTFYPKFIRIVFQASRLSKQGIYDYPAWCHSSLRILRALESVGVQAEVSGIHHLKGVEGPCVIIANHMSMLETVILPIIVQPVKNVTFIVKQGLLEYPVFKHVMASRDPIAVTRANPREDFKNVMEGGKERLKNGISIVVFPQTTRTTRFKPENFNSIGVKLAQRATVPIVPLALKTDAWQNGQRLKDFGKIDISRKVRFAFGEPIFIEGRGANEQGQVVEFVSGKLAEWGDSVIGNR
ncbi:lysophospholipid acyltransferase family protein [Planctomycetota bacterium]